MKGHKNMENNQLSKWSQMMLKERYINYIVDSVFQNGQYTMNRGTTGYRGHSRKTQFYLNKQVLTWMLNHIDVRFVYHPWDEVIEVVGDFSQLISHLKNYVHDGEWYKTIMNLIHYEEDGRSIYDKMKSSPYQYINFVNECLLASVIDGQLMDAKTLPLDKEGCEKVIHLLHDTLKPEEYTFIKGHLVPITKPDTHQTRYCLTSRDVRINSYHTYHYDSEDEESKRILAYMKDHVKVMDKIVKDVRLRLLSLEREFNEMKIPHISYIKKQDLINLISFEKGK